LHAIMQQLFLTMIYLLRDSVVNSDLLSFSLFIILIHNLENSGIQRYSRALLKFSLWGIRGNRFFLLLAGK
jgi:hypothetical protein